MNNFQVYIHGMLDDYTQPPYEVEIVDKRGGHYRTQVNVMADWTTIGGMNPLLIKVNHPAPVTNILKKVCGNMKYLIPFVAFAVLFFTAELFSPRLVCYSDNSPIYAMEEDDFPPNYCNHIERASLF